jgi:hypothetical protein
MRGLLVTINLIAVYARIYWLLGQFDTFFQLFLTIL